MSTEVAVAVRTYSDVPTAEEYAFAFENNTSRTRRLMIRIGSLADPFYRLEGWAESQIHAVRTVYLPNLETYVAKKVNTVVDGFRFIFRGHTGG